MHLQVPPAAVEEVAAQGAPRDVYRGYWVRWPSSIYLENYLHKSRKEKRNEKSQYNP